MSRCGGLPPCGFQGDRTLGCLPDSGPGALATSGSTAALSPAATRPLVWLGPHMVVPATEPAFVLAGLWGGGGAYVEPGRGWETPASLSALKGRGLTLLSGLHTCVETSQRHHSRNKPAKRTGGRNPRSGLCYTHQESRLSHPS